MFCERGTVSDIGLQQTAEVRTPSSIVKILNVDVKRDDAHVQERLPPQHERILNLARVVVLLPQCKSIREPLLRWQISLGRSISASKRRTDLLPSLKPQGHIDRFGSSFGEVRRA